MNRLSEGIRNILDKWREAGKGKKIAIIVLIVGVISAIVLGTVSATATKYGVLFSKLDSSDSATIIQKLKDQKISYKVDSSTNTIMVPQQNVDELRLELAPSIKDGSTGFELFDNTSQFGMTDDQFKVNYQRALEGELERTIKGFSEIDGARVQLVMPDDSVFVKDSTPGKASVTLKLKAGASLNKDEVKAIVALVSGSVKNLPQQNVQVIDDKMTLLTQNLFNGDGSDDSTADAENRNKIQTTVEKEKEQKALEQLEAVYGKGKVKVKINVDLNFDAQETNSQTYYNNQANPNDTKNPVIVSSHTIKDVNPQGSTTTSGSPNDNNNSSNTITNNNTTNTNSTHDEATTNYDVSSETTKTVKAPGDVRRMTASVVIDGNINANTQASVTNLLGGAIGFNAARGDTIDVEGMTFDNTDQKNAQKALDEINKQLQQEKTMQLYKEIGIGAGAFVAFMIILVVLLRKRKKKAVAANENSQFDVVIDDTIEPKEEIKFAPIEFETNDESTHIEKEVKKYASDKPEQVADIVKSWLAKDER
ncbi:MAG: flagellar basal-body MS-ring/collar protein FliF [Bacillota bacterium]|nr:flagellar basal-body MS-ring/collar protein FliF [Bacillota bacterium]